MIGLKIELILVLLLDGPQVRSQRRFDGCIVVVVLLSLDEGVNIGCWDDPWLCTRARVAFC
jgi:hypothetical protein